MNEAVRPTISLDNKSLPEWLTYWSEIGSLMDVIETEPFATPKHIFPKHDMHITSPFQVIYPKEKFAKGKVDRVTTGSRARDASLWAFVEMEGSCPNSGTFFTGVESLPPDQGIHYIIHEKIKFQKSHSLNGNAAVGTGMEISAGRWFSCAPIFERSYMSKLQANAYPSYFQYLYQHWKGSKLETEAVTPETLLDFYARGAYLISEIRGLLSSKEYQEADAPGHL